MKLEYRPTGSKDCPLIRLFDFSAKEAQQLLLEVTRLANGDTQRIDLHALPWVESTGDCRLSLCTNAWDQAIIQTGEPADFECRFTPQSWDNIAGLIEPFADRADGFQWLADVPGIASLLLSSSGQW